MKIPSLATTLDLIRAPPDFNMAGLERDMAAIQERHPGGFIPRAVGREDHVFDRHRIRLHLNGADIVVQARHGRKAGHPAREPVGRKVVKGECRCGFHEMLFYGVDVNCVRLDQRGEDKIGIMLVSERGEMDAVIRPEFVHRHLFLLQEFGKIDNGKVFIPGPFPCRLAVGLEVGAHGYVVSLGMLVHASRDRVVDDENSFTLRSADLSEDFGEIFHVARQRNPRDLGPGKNIGIVDAEFDENETRKKGDDIVLDAIESQRRGIPTSSCGSRADCDRRGAS